MYLNRFYLIFAVVLFFLVYSCTSVPKKVETAKPRPAETRESPAVPDEIDKEMKGNVKALPSEEVQAAIPEAVDEEETEESELPREEIKVASLPKEEEKKSLEIFTEILGLVESTEDRETVMPKVEGLYEKIITEYPTAPLAQESYWKLISIYVDEYTPPNYGKAELRYGEFINKYPKSYYRGFIEDTLGNSYYKNSEWNNLLNLTAPAYEKYLESGKQPSASMLFMYSEANYQIGNMQEAEAGYTILADKFSKMIVGIKAKEMLKQIKKSRD